MRFNDIHKACF